jgi:hypothetical protein
MSDYILYEAEFKGLNNDIINSLWNVAVFNAPYKTGNLRSAIQKQLLKKGVRFNYNDSEAFYVDFLERGIGRNKKHVGFIEFGTVDAMLTELMFYINTGMVSNSAVPFVKYKKDKARNYERQMMRKLNMDLSKNITAEQRAEFSRRRYMQNKKGKNKLDNKEARLKFYRDEVRTSLGQQGFLEMKM